MSEYERRGGERTGGGHVHAPRPEQFRAAPTAEERARDARSSAERELAALEHSVGVLRATRDPRVWKELRTSLGRAVERARTSLLRAGEHLARLNDGSAHERMNERLEDLAGALGRETAPLGYREIAMERSVLAVIEELPAGGAHEGFAAKERALVSTFGALSTEDRRELSRRLSTRREGDPIAAAFHERFTPERRARVMAQLSSADRRLALAPKEPEPARGEEGSAAPRQPHVDLVDALTSDGAAGLLGACRSLDGSARRALARRLETYRPGSGDELAARFMRLDREPRQQVLGALRSEGAGAYPFAAQVQESFGRHSIGSLQANVSAEAGERGAEAFAIGERVTFGQTPDLHTAAHEATHAVLQRAGVGPIGEGRAGDSFEQHADAVADRVLRGESAEELISAVVDRAGNAAGPIAAVQKKERFLSAPEYVNRYADEILKAVEARIAFTGVVEPHPRLRWSRERDPAFVIGRKVRAYVTTTPSATLKALMKLAQPVDLLAAIEEAGSATAASGWRADVGAIVATALDVPLVTSVRTMGARMRAVLDTREGPLRSADLVASDPLDGLVADVLVEPGMVSPVAALRGRDDTGERRLRGGAREVTYRWMGKEDPHLWNWIRVTAPAHPTVEDVAHTPLMGGEVADGSEQAYRIVASPPYFGIPFETASRVPEAIAYAPDAMKRHAERGDPGPAKADADVLATSVVVDEAALAQSPAPQASDPTVATSLELVLLQLDFLTVIIRPWHAEGALWAAHAFAGRRRTELATDPRKAVRWAPVLAGQERILRPCARKLDKLLAMLKNQGATPADVPVLGSVMQVIEAYVQAASVAHLHAQGPDELAAAEHLDNLLPLSLAQDRLRAARATIGAERASEEQLGHTIDADAASRDMTKLTSRAADLRLDAARVTKLDPDAVDELAAEADVVALKARIRKIRNDAKLLDREADEVGFTKQRYERGLPTLRAVETALQVEGTTWLGELDAAESVTFARRPDGQSPAKLRAQRLERAVATVKGQMKDWGERFDLAGYLKDAKQQIVDERFVQRVNDFLLQLGIMAVTTVVGSGMVSAARGAAIGLGLISEIRAASVGFKLAETAVQAGLATAGQAVTGSPVGGEDFAENALAMLLTEAAMKPFSGMFASNAALEEEVKTVASRLRKGAAAVAHVALETGAGIAGSHVARSIVKGGSVDAASTEEAVTQGLSIVAGRIVGRRMEEANQRLAEAARKRADQHLADLRDRAARVAARARVEKLLTREEVRELLRDEHQLLAEEKTAYRDHPELARERKGNASARAAMDERFLDVPFQLAGLRPVVDGHIYQGSWKEIEQAFQAAQENGIAFTSRFDPETSTWHLQAGKRQLQVHVEGHLPPEHVEAARARGTRSADRGTEPEAGPAPKVPRPTGRSGPDLHSHFMGIRDVQYFVAELGSGSNTAAFTKVHDMLAADPKAQKAAAHAWKIAREAHASIEARIREGGSSKEIESEARAALEKMLAAGEETPYDKTYQIRGLIVEKAIGYPKYIKDSITALADAGIGYSEQSIGVNKLEESFDQGTMKHAHDEASAAGRDADVRFLAVVPTTALAGKVAPAEVAKTKERLRALLQRGDVIGIDIASPEKHPFTAEGMANFRELYELVAAAAAVRKRPLVLRPHVGEGYAEGGKTDHASIAQGNLDTLIRALEEMGYSATRGEKDGVIIRFGHATHATAGQMERIARLGVIVEANIGSNVVTGSVNNARLHPLLLGLYYGVDTVLGTDGEGVMGTPRRGEYDVARQILEEFRKNERSIKIEGRDLRFRDLDEVHQRRFSLEAIESMEDDYYRRVIEGDRRETAIQGNSP